MPVLGLIPWGGAGTLGQKEGQTEDDFTGREPPCQLWAPWPHPGLLCSLRGSYGWVTFLSELENSANWREGRGVTRPQACSPFPWKALLMALRWPLLALSALVLRDEPGRAEQSCTCLVCRTEPGTWLLGPMHLIVERTFLIPSLVAECSLKGDNTNSLGGTRVIG